MDNSVFISYHHLATAISFRILFCIRCIFRMLLDLAQPHSWHRHSSISVWLLDYKVNVYYLTKARFFGSMAFLFFKAFFFSAIWILHVSFSSKHMPRYSLHIYMSVGTVSRLIEFIIRHRMSSEPYDIFFLYIHIHSFSLPLSLLLTPQTSHLRN